MKKHGSYREHLTTAAEQPNHHGETRAATIQKTSTLTTPPQLNQRSIPPQQRWQGLSHEMVRPGSWMDPPGVGWVEGLGWRACE